MSSSGRATTLTRCKSTGLVRILGALDGPTNLRLQAAVCEAAEDLTWHCEYQRRLCDAALGAAG